MIVIIDYGMGNLYSVSKALESTTNEKIIISNEVEKIKSSNKIVLPGVGSFSNAMNNLQKLNLIPRLYQEVIINKKPLLGICLGMQILAEEGYENGFHKGLGFIPGKVKKFNLDSENYKMPHVGWNNIIISKKNPFLEQPEDFYFVHSYHLECPEESLIIAKCNYGYDFVAAIKKDNIFATQFHPEKSQQAGLKVIKKFIDWEGT